MIIVRLEGGLGNQMFQYAIGKQLSLLNNTTLKFDLSSYEKILFENKAFWRGYALDIFEAAVEIASADDVKKVKESKTPFFEKISYRLQRLKEIPYFRKTELFEKKLFSFDKNMLTAAKNTYLTGYWQSPKYFSDIRTVLLSDFKLKEKPSAENYNFIDKIPEQESVSIHVRRGDYVTNPETFKLHGVCSLDYYNDAIEYIKNNVANPFFYVFSDDIEWAQNNINLSRSVVFVKDTPPGKDYFEMHLMSLCKHNIIANSSFSWWGAWLNKNSDKIVVAPKKWMNDPSIDTTDLIPENWIRL